MIIREETREIGEGDYKRYYSLQGKYKQICEDTALFIDKSWSVEDVNSIKSFLLTASREAHPNVNRSYWEHVILSGLFARKIAESIGEEILEPNLAESVGLLHHLGLVISPKRDAAITDAFFKSAKTRQVFMSALPPRRHIFGLNGELDLPGKMSDSQRITYMGEILARKKTDTTLHRSVSLISWLRELPTKKPIVSGVFPSELRTKTLHATTDHLRVVCDFSITEIGWLKSRFGLSIDNVCEEVENMFNTPKVRTTIEMLSKNSTK